MWRISLKHAKPGMVLGHPVFDGSGHLLMESGVELDHDSITKLSIYSVGELLIDEPLLADIPVQRFVPPEVMAEATQALRQLLTESQGCDQIDPFLLEQLERPVYAITRESFPEVIGEPNVSGCLLPEAYDYTQPVKTAVLCLMLGSRAGMDIGELANLAMSATLMNVGYIQMSAKTMAKWRTLGEESDEFWEHPTCGARLIADGEWFDPQVVQTILEHHERWDGTGYPAGLKGKHLSLSARVLAVADTYYELISRGSNKLELMPHQAVEYLMAAGGEAFDPEIVHLFVRHVPLYPTGITVQLNSGQTGVVSNPNLGHVGRPLLRICMDEDLRPLPFVYEIDLSESAQQDRYIVQALEY